MSLPGIPVPKERLSDEDIERFVRCRHCYYRKCRNAHESSWVYAAQASVNQIVHAYYSRAPEARTAASVLCDMESYWTPERDRFPSEQHYLRIKRSVFHFLDEYLTGEAPGHALLLGEKLNVQAVEVGADLSMTLQVAECSDSSLVIRKYVVADEPQVFKAYVQFALVFAYKAFGRLPDRIEIYALMNGSAYAFRPKEEHYHSSLDFVRLMLGVMNEGPMGSGLYH
ncbi:cobyrinic acid a,c-diamide synthase [Paenibacillus dendritiformis]|uniref:cobyrinic acid a,c-diamide synthase n=1 Tax=Paenibacillus dendritiformis TaxID=130049 RepID=UPI00105A84F4|nr:cobyrinic acid a,c-diamide synthase [Paenibacillus dendritiformis]TDL58184.1 cobyrinic acid a,c-diamide synthase [Paenibacillus dendritiformis]